MTVADGRQPDSAVRAEKQQHHAQRKPPSAVLRTALILGIVVWLCAPLAAFAYLSSTSNSTELTSSTTVWQPVRENTTTVRERISLALEWGSGTPVVSPSWEGTVQSVNVAAGSRLADGDIVATVSGVQRRAFAGKTPLWRSLSRGDSGTDVAALNTWLADIGYTVTQGKTFTQKTLTAVRDYAGDIGVTTKVSSFEPAWVVFLPAHSISIGEVDLTPGAPAPAAGQPVITQNQKLISATLIAEASGGDSGQDESEATNTAPSAADTITAETDQALYVGDTKIELNTQRSAASSMGIKTLSKLVSSDATKVSAALTSAAKQGQLVVPTDAVFTDANSKTCVASRSSTSSAPRGVEIAIVSQNVGSLIVTGQLGASDSVAIAPPADIRTCE